MVFSSTVFLFLFLPIVLIVYYNPFHKLRSRPFRNAVLLLASLAFYAWGEPIFVFLMMFSIVITWGFGLTLEKNHSKTVLTVGICYHVAILFIFKYLTFAASQLGLLLARDFSFISISLPIGISFFTFQLMSYLFDIYYGKAHAQRNLFYVGLYVSLFPQLIAGPIVRYETIALQIENRNETLDDVLLGMKRFIYGLGKKVLLANFVAQIADNVFDVLAVNASVMTAWLGAICYALQIYFDFSGYSDMAIGLGRMFGFRFNENFNYPYMANSITDFWRRWHISLSSWFRDYVYIPLGGNRVSKPRWAFNLLVVWLLTGIWHGANWTFIAWGLVYFVFLLLEKTLGYTKKIGWLSHMYTIFVVILAWVIFRSANITDACVYIGKMFGVGAAGIVDTAFKTTMKATWIVFVIACIGATPILKNGLERLRKTKFEWLESLWLVFVFGISLLQTVSSTYNPFIYFNF